MFSFIHKIKQWYKHQKLIKQSVLIPITSYDQYAALVKEAKDNSKNKVFSNCYMLPAEIKRLIHLKKFYKVKTEQGLAFADDEGDYYYLFLYVNMSVSFTFPSLEKDILIENVYYEGRKNKKQEIFESFLLDSGCEFLNTYRSIEDRPSLSPDKFFKKLEVLEKTLALEGKKIAIPSYKQLDEFEKVYRSIIDKFVQKKYTRKERKAQADAGYLYCITDESASIYAIAIKACVHGGAYGSRSDCQNNIYAPILVLYLFKDFYDNMPNNPVKEKEQQRHFITYTEEQEGAIRTFENDYKKGIRKTYLLYGVTGSGKTEVYMEMIRQVVKEKRQAIVLIPEIALTYQTVMRFYRTFGERVSIMNSRLSAGERYDQMMRAKKGEIDVMIGPRSALFTPFPSLGLIVIDEEHEAAYKSEQVPRYHARETAIERASLEGASVVLGSATPSMEAFYRCELGEYTLLELKRRTAKAELPEVYTVDMREELQKGNRSILSDRLHELMEDRLKKKEQIILFLNRRGYAGFLSCRSCGYVVKCPHCDVSLATHNNGKMVCHYCGYEETVAKKCPSCGSPHIGGFRAGTQQIEELVKKEFPQARVLRMDLDTTRSKEGHEKILSAFANEEADILVGTQMIVKGHDFPNVTLVGVLAADMSLYSDDFRSAERTFELLTQAAGRAGRGKKKGEVVIQTYSPEHYSIQTAARQDYQAFYTEEMNYRELMGYPPAEHLMAVLVACEDEALLEKGMHYLKLYAMRITKNRKVQVIGPAAPAVGKVKDVYRKVLYLKQESYEILIEMKDKMEQYIELNRGFAKMRIQFDFDPMSGF